MALLLLTVTLLVLNYGKAQNTDCLQPADSQGRSIPFRDINGSPRLPSDTQAIVTSYRFNCCGNITRWQTYVQPGGGGHENGIYSIRFQVWRPLNIISGCYSIVGENQYDNIQLVVDSGGLVNETVPSSNIITVQPGDVVGYYTESENGGNEGIQLDTSYSDETIWYHTNSDDDPLVFLNGDCHYPIGSQSVLKSSTNAGPILSVGIATFDCLQSMTSTITSTISPTTTTSIISSLSISPTPVPVNTSPLPQSIAPTPQSTTPPTPQSTTPPIPHSTTPLNTMPTASTTERPTIASKEDGPSSNLISVIIAVISLVFVIIMVMLIIVFIVLLMRKRVAVRGSKIQSNDAIRVSDLSNPNYDSPSLPEQKPSKGKRKFHPKPLPAPLNNATYEVIDSDDPVDYTYPKPSPTTRYSPELNTLYSYIATHEEGGANEDGIYHMIGPKSSSSMPPPVPRRGDSSNNVYNILEGPANFYETPPPEFQEPMKELFDSIGSYVPTEEQRQTFGNAYEQLVDVNKHDTYSRLQFFVEDKIYWAPATTASGLYAQLASKKYREIQRNQIRIQQQLGSGQFGEVCKALWTVSGHTLDLAVKTLKPSASEDDKIKFLQEAAIMGQFSHSNVIKIHGVVTVGEPVMICLELLTNGDLRSYLSSLPISGRVYKDFMETQILFLKFAREIAAGMKYLSEKSFVHRDLAARNVLLNESLTCKIGDFGMARDLMDDTYYKSSGGKIPVKWTAPEALLYKRYSPDSDVWSYGMVLFEIWSIAKKPFSTITNNQVLKLIQTGFCQAPPPGCPRTIYELMVNSWNPVHQERPSFKEICNHYLQKPLSKILYWSSEDDNLSPSVGVLGACLEEAFELHLDLQEKYRNTDIRM